MGFAAEMRDFLGAYKAVTQTASESQYRNAMADYYKNGGRSQHKAGLYGYADPVEAPKTENFFSRLLGSNEVKTEPALSPTDEAADRIARAHERAMRAGDMSAVKKLEDDAATLRSYLPGTGSGKPKASAPKAAIPDTATDSDAGRYVPTPSVKKPIMGIDDEDTYAYATGGFVEGDEEAGYDSEPDNDYDDEIASRMTEIAQPGIAAGVQRIQASVASNAAIPQAEGGDGAAALARNEGAASHDEVAAIDKMIDPESKLPAHARSAARIAAIWDTLGEKDPDKAASLAQSLLLYDKQNSQTRGQLAQEALNQGDMKKAVRYISDAYNEDLPGDARIIPAVAENGDVTVKVIQGGQVASEDKVEPQQVAAMAQKVASGSAYIDKIIPLAARSESRKGQKEAVAASGRADPEVMNEVLLARRAYARAMDSNDGSDGARKNIDAARQAVDDAEEKAIGYAMKQKNPASFLKQLGISAVPSSVGAPKGVATKKAAGGARGPNLTAKERAALADEAEVQGIQKKLYNAASLEQAGIQVDDRGRALPVEVSPSGYRSEAAAVEKARRTIEPKRKALEDQLADAAYNQAGDNKSLEKKSYGERVAPIEEALNGYLTDKSPNAKQPIEMKPEDRRFVLRTADRLALKNDVDPRQIIEFIDGATTDLTKPVKVDRRTGMVNFGGNKMFVDGDTLMAIAQKRGETVKMATADRNKKWMDEANAVESKRTAKQAAITAEDRRRDRASSRNLEVDDAKFNADFGKAVRAIPQAGQLSEAQTASYRDLLSRAEAWMEKHQNDNTPEAAYIRQRATAIRKMLGSTTP